MLTIYDFWRNDQVQNPVSGSPVLHGSKERRHLALLQEFRQKEIQDAVDNAGSCWQIEMVAASGADQTSRLLGSLSLCYLP